MRYTSILVIAILVIFTGCFSQTPYNQYIDIKFTQPLHNNLHSAISEISKQLLKTTKKPRLLDGVVITSFVDLKDFKKTTQFGRLLGESMLTELHSLGFKVLDFRGRDAIVVNKTGEFYITRDTKFLRDEIDNANILVGTYSQFDQDSILLNVRIMEFETGTILSSARVVYTTTDCKLLNNCIVKKMNIIKDN